ncbi:MAG: hypothetical protein JXR76_15335 [Deltaproteobacteria bacterium]|nr:hypothetical protein [Deltaproteobacteria bacterium]
MVRFKKSCQKRVSSGWWPSRWRRRNRSKKSRVLTLVDGGKRSGKSTPLTMLESAKTAPLMRFNSDDSFRAYCLLQSLQFMFFQRLTRSYESLLSELVMLMQSVEFRDFEVLRRMSDIENCKWSALSMFRELSDIGSEEELLSIQLQKWLRMALEVTSSIYIQEKRFTPSVVRTSEGDSDD